MAFKLYIRFTGQTAKLQSGEFRLSSSFSLFQTADTLFKGPIELWVTIPEGLRREEIAVRFATGLDKDSSFVSDFLQASGGKKAISSRIHIFFRWTLLPPILSRR